MERILIPLVPIAHHGCAQHMAYRINLSADEARALGWDDLAEAIEKWCGE